MVALVFLSGPAAGLRHEVAGQLTIGRSRGCEIALEDDKVSRQHARIELERGELRIRDLGSRNGTRVNGQRIAREVVLFDGDRIQLGDSTARLELDEEIVPAGSERTELQRRSIDSLLAESGAGGGLLTCIDLLQASTEAAILRRAAAGLAEQLGSRRAVAFPVHGRPVIAGAGLAPLDPPRQLIRQALDRGDIVRAGEILCIPLTSNRGERFGAICTERDAEPTAAELKLAAVFGRLTGEALAAARLRTQREPPFLIGTSANFRKLVERAGRLASSDQSVSIFGESGSGRSAIARYIHSHSARSFGPLIAVNCAADAVPEEELFALAGAPESKSALLRADGGTLVLMHVELLGRPLAQRLARALVARSAPVNAREQRVDLRTIAIGRDPLEVLALQRRIPRELANALPSAVLQVPPLRERSTDVPTLFKFFAHELCRQMGREPPRLSPDAKRALMAYAWPGNVTELRLIAERLALLYPGLEVPVIRLPAELLESSPAGKSPTLHHRVRALERAAIAEALSAAGGKKIRAAELLGISRPTLDKKLRELHLVSAASMERQG
jgi:DNA-binding NtrC family response regulator